MAKKQEEFKIEKGVPVPKSGGQGIGKYPFNKMEVGDSVFFSGSKYSIGAVRTASLNWARYNGKKVMSRKEGDGVRIWRVA